MQVAGHKQRPPLHPLEKWFLGVVILELVFLPWAFGGRDIWSQVTCLVLATLGFGLAMLQRNYSADLAGGPAFCLNPRPRLWKFPLFWLGLALMVYLAVQGLNPFKEMKFTAKSWLLVNVDDIAWLPTSIDVPFERFNVWRQMIIYGAVWLTVCGLWLGITRRKSLHVLLGVLAANASLLALVGFVHKGSGDPKVLWLLDVRNAGPFASFVYRNHAGAYFGLVAFATLGLAVWHFFEGRKRLARSTPAALWLIVSLLLVFTVVLSLSRGATLSLAVFGLAAVVALVFLHVTSTTQSTTPMLVNVALVGIILATFGFVIRAIDFGDVKSRFESMTELQAKDRGVSGRVLARAATWDMYQDHWLRGIGAGGFRHLFPGYQWRYPEIYRAGRLLWEHAHIDWLEIPVELGLAGVILIASGVGWAIRFWWRQGGRRHPVALMVVFGLGQTLLHATIDFPLQNTAVLITWWALLVLSLRWLELDSHGAV